MGDADDIYARMERCRKARGISIAELARRIGTDRKRLWYVLNGQREMRVDEFLKLCLALRVDPRSFASRKMVEEIGRGPSRIDERRER